jgi:hypothetical protein
VQVIRHLFDSTTVIEVTSLVKRYPLDDLGSDSVHHPRIGHSWRSQGGTHIYLKYCFQWYRARRMSGGSSDCSETYSFSFL